MKKKKKTIAEEEDGDEDEGDGVVVNEFGACLVDLPLIILFFFLFFFTSMAAQVERCPTGDVQDRLRRQLPLHLLQPLAVPSPAGPERPVPHPVVGRALPVLHQRGGRRRGGALHRLLPRGGPCPAPGRGGPLPGGEESR